MYCTQCGSLLDDDANFCHQCGTEVRRRISEIQQTTPAPVSLSATAHISDRAKPIFTGKGSDILSRNGLKMLLWYASIVGIPVGWLYTLRWVMRHISLPSGRNLSFSGTIRQAYWLFFLTIVVSLLKRVDPGDNEAFRGFNQDAIALIWSVVVIGLQSLVYREVYKWTCASVAVGAENPLSFTGQAWPYVAWTILTIISLFTIIGWAWVETAFLRWQFSHTVSVRHRFAFVGSGRGLLWRSLVALVGSMAIVPIPWIVAWLYKWAIQNIEVQWLGGPKPEPNSIVTAA